MQGAPCKISGDFAPAHTRPGLLGSVSLRRPRLHEPERPPVPPAGMAVLLPEAPTDDLLAAGEERGRQWGGAGALLAD